MQARLGGLVWAFLPVTEGCYMTYTNETDGMCATVTPVSKGWVVCLIDIEAEDGIVATRLYKDEKEANRKARYWVWGCITKEGL